MFCLQPTGPVPTAIEWYNPQGQLVSRDGRDEVNQAGYGRAAFLSFIRYQQSQGGRYECRVTGSRNNLEKLSVCIGECCTLSCFRLCLRQDRDASCMQCCDNCALTAWPVTEYQRQRDMNGVGDDWRAT